MSGGLARGLLADALSPAEIAELKRRAPGSTERALLARWETRLTPPVFARRLAELGLDRRGALSRLAPPVLPKNYPLPAWAVFLDEAAAEGSGERPSLPSRASGLGAEEIDAFALDVRPSPLFPVFLNPFLAAAWRRLGEKESTLPVLRHLLVRLSRASARTLAHELKSSGLGYAEFMASPAAFRAALSRRPMLARLLSTLTLDAVDAARETLARLDADRAALAAHFFGGRDPGPLIALRPGLSDPHRGGRTVTRLEFESGRSLIYKPRSGAGDAAFADLARWSGLGPRAPAFLDRGVYGWQERLRPSPRRGRRYFEKQGELLALLSFLGAADFHADNFVAADGAPVPVDFEGLFAHDAGLRWAPLAVGLLPAWRDAGPDVLPEISSGLAGAGRRPYAYPRPAWTGEETADLSLAYAVPAGPARGPADPKAVLKGFDRAARRLRGRAAPPLPRALKSRVLLRSTQDYLEFLLWSAAPDLLVSSAAFEVALETFGFTEPEKEALRRHDVPVVERPAQIAAARTRLRRAAAEEASSAGRAAAAVLRLPEFRLKRRRGEPLLAHAVAIGEALGELAVPAPEGKVWLDLARLSGAGRGLALKTTGPFLYDGGAGVGLYLSDLAAATGRRDFRRLADAAFDAALAAARSAKSLPRSGFTGAGSLLYALASAGRLEEAARLIPAGGGADPDVLNGDAGLCLALLSLHRRRPSPAALAAARRLGVGLLSARPGGEAGFGHGPAGTAAALARLGDATGEERFLAGAERLLALAESRRAPGGWCGGEVGLELARLTLGRTAGAAALVDGARHHLCCGEAGRIVFLARAGRRGDARAAAKDLIAFLAERGVWRFQGFVEKPFLPGLMGGITGIGLALLTARDPASATDVLRLS